MSGKGGVWVLAEEREGSIHQTTFELIAWARRLADRLDDWVTCLALGAATHAAGSQLLARGADCVIAVQHENLATFRLDPYVRIIRRLVQDDSPEILLSAASTTGRTLMPVLAVLLRTGLTADCTELGIDPIDGRLLQTRPAIGGNVLATIKTPDRFPQMATVRPKSCEALPYDPARSGIVRAEIPLDGELASRVRRIGFESSVMSSQPLEDAAVVVAGGKGMGGRDGFRLAEELATALGAAVGASRVAVDHGWAPYAQQIGLSGKSVRPRLYVALGISGSPNHLAGMATSERVVAINKDPDADIFHVADLGIVGDVHEIVPALLRHLGKGG